MKKVFQAFKKLTRIQRVGVVMLAAFLSYVLIGFIGVPLAFRVFVFSKLNHTFVGELKVDHVRFNPFTCEFKLQGFTGTDPDGQVAVSFEEFRINIQPTSLLGDDYKVKELVLDRPDGILCIDEDGGINLVDLFEATQKSEAEKEPSEPFVIPSVVIEHLEVRDAGFQIKIDTVEPSFVREIDRLSFVMNDLRTDASHGNQYNFELSTLDGEKLTIQGAVFFDPLSTVGTISLESLKLPSFTSFGSALVDADIKSGELGLSLGYRFRPLAAEPEIGIENGQLDLRDFELVEKGSDQLIHRVASMQAKGLEFDVVNRAARLESLLLDGASLLVVRDPSGEIELLKKPSVEKSVPASPDIADTKTEVSGEIQLGVIAADQDLGLVFTKASEQVGLLSGDAGSIAISFDDVSIQNSHIRFRDRSLQPAVSLGVAIPSITAGPYDSTSGRPMGFKAKMNLEDGAKGGIEISGGLVPDAPLASTDVTVVVSGLGVAPFSGYAVPAIGRPLNSGSLNADLKYSIKGGLIEAENKLTLEQLKLGDRVEDSDAPRLPLDLAIAILENREGLIKLDVPMSGDVNHPKFSAGRMVAYAFQNVIEKIVTAPFSVLSNLLPGEGGVDAKSFNFERGSTKMVDGGDELVEKLAKVLAARPQLVIQLTPTYVSGKDAKELRDKRFEAAVKAICDKGKDRKEAIKQLHEALPKDKQAGGWPFKKMEDIEKAVRASMLVANDSDGLSEKRANAVKEALLKQDGVKASQVVIKDAVEAETTRVDFSVGVK